MALYLLLEPEWSPHPVGVRLQGRKLVVGRLKGLDVVLPDESVAPRHCTLLKRGSSFLINVESSEHPTYLFEEVGDARILLAPDAPRVLEDGSRVQLGDLILRVRLSEPEGEVEWIDQDALAKTLVKRALAYHGHPSSARDVKEALKELLLDAAAESPSARAALVTESASAPPTEQSRATVTLVLLIVALALALGALYWLLLPDTPRSL
jgi:predicted component of type VI protein secretion system